VRDWLAVVAGPGDELEILPYDSALEEGRHTGGHVIMVHNEEEDNTFLFAIPPEVIVLLKGMLPDDRYYRLLGRTLGLAMG
jgi:hypothetical protein